MIGQIKLQKNILLLTGWGATCSVWERIIPALDKGCQINCIPPSWIGDKKYGSLSDIENYVDNLADSLRSPVTIIAWSMGGLIAIKLASRYPDLVSNLCFISSVPNFVSTDNENSGIDFDWFTQFVMNFDEAPIETMKKFLVLQTMNDEFAKDTLKAIRKHVALEKYDLNECRIGLELLKLNLLEELVSLKCKKLFIHGDVDAVVDIQTAINAADLTDSQCFIIEGAGHVPHLSHAAQVSDILHSHI